MGYHTRAEAPESTALGKYNVGSTTSTLEVGYGDDISSKNALTIKNNGYMGGKDITDPQAVFHLGYASNNGRNNHIRLEYNANDYRAFIYDFDGFKFRTFGAGDLIIFRNSNNKTSVTFFENGDVTIRGTLTEISDRTLKTNINQ